MFSIVATHQQQQKHEQNNKKGYLTVHILALQPLVDLVFRVNVSNIFLLVVFD